MGMGLLGMLRRPLERRAATGIATGIVIMLAAFSIFVDVYLICLATH
jgi:hypothetical protein